jgi:hypothetical protein
MAVQTSASIGGVDFREQFEWRGIGQVTGSLPRCPSGYVIAEHFVNRDDFAYPPLDGGGELNRRLIVERVLEFPRVEDAMTRAGVRELHRKIAKPGYGSQGISDEDILSLAGRFGLLRGELRVLEPGAPGPEDPLVNVWGFRRAERLEAWIELVDKLNALLAVWDLVRDTDAFPLRSYFRRAEDGGHWQMYFGWDGKQLTTSTADTLRYRVTAPTMDDLDAVLAGRVPAGWKTIDWAFNGETLPDKLKKLDIAKVREAARIAVYQEINEGLAGNVEAVLDPVRRPFRALTFRPKNLAGAIWLHFAMEVAENAPTLAVCEKPGCGRSFRPRSNKRYCSDACRNEQWRAIRARARKNNPETERSPAGGA